MPSEVAMAKEKKQTVRKALGARVGTKLLVNKRIVPKDRRTAERERKAQKAAKKYNKKK